MGLATASPSALRPSASAVLFIQLLALSPKSTIPVLLLSLLILNLLLIILIYLLLVSHCECSARKLEV